MFYRVGEAIALIRLKTVEDDFIFTIPDDLNQIVFRNKVIKVNLEGTIAAQFGAAGSGAYFVKIYYRIGGSG